MRICIKTTPNTELVPFNYQHKLVGTLHKWIGVNNLHGRMALYSFSWLQRSKANRDGLNFPGGAEIFVSFHDTDYLNLVINTIMHDTKMCYGLNVNNVSVVKTPDFRERTLFHCASPIFVRRIEGERDNHYTFENENAGEFLKETLLHKMEIAGLPEDADLKIRFDPSSKTKRTKIIDYRGIKNRVNLCPVIMEGRPETKEFAWNVGLGNSTGIGFGAIY